jgi:hypothetical protein
LTYQTRTIEPPKEDPVKSMKIDPKRAGIRRDLGSDYWVVFDASGELGRFPTQGEAYQEFSKLLHCHRCGEGHLGDCR